MFEIYQREVEINGTKYTLKPLSGKYLPKLYSLVSVFDKVGKDDAFASALDEKTVEIMFTVCFESFRSSYPNEPAEKLEAFVSQNLVKIFPAVVEVNLNNVQS